MRAGYDNLGPMQYRGTWFVNEDQCHGYVGFVFGYQTSSKFYVVMWKHEHRNWYDANSDNIDDRGGIKGIQLKVCTNRRSIQLHIASKTTALHVSAGELGERAFCEHGAGDLAQ